MGLVLVCISLFYILANSQFVASAHLLIYVGVINVLIIFDVMFINGLEYDKKFLLWTLGDGTTFCFDRCNCRGPSIGASTDLINYSSRFVNRHRYILA
ncbi:hypothetical protein V2J09_021277 [Rumex salicifolius]